MFAASHLSSDISCPPTNMFLSLNSYSLTEDIFGKKRESFVQMEWNGKQICFQKHIFENIFYFQFGEILEDDSFNAPSMLSILCFMHSTLIFFLLLK